MLKNHHNHNFVYNDALQLLRRELNTLLVTTIL